MTTLIASQAETPAAQAGVFLWMQDESIEVQYCYTDDGNYQHYPYHQHGSMDISELLTERP